MLRASEPERIDAERGLDMALNPPVILLVEDEQDHAELVRRCFDNSEIEHQIVHVSDGELALDFLFRRGRFAHGADCPRLILLDQRLPKVDGLQVLKQIKMCDELLRIPVVMLTTSNAANDKFEAYGNYVNSYLVKPVEFGEFAQLLNEMIHYWLKQNQPLDG